MSVEGRGCEINMFFHCRQCLEEGLPDGVSPQEHQRVQVGLIDNGDLQVWCVRHDREILTTAIKRAENSTKWVQELRESLE